jgi:hypothetical protein
MTDDTSKPFDAFLSAFWKDVDAGAVRPLAAFINSFLNAFHDESRSVSLSNFLKQRP